MLLLGLREDGLGGDYHWKVVLSKGGEVALVVSWQVERGRRGRKGLFEARRQFEGLCWPIDIRVGVETAPVKSKLGFLLKWRRWGTPALGRTKVNSNYALEVCVEAHLKAVGSILVLVKRNALFTHICVVLEGDHLALIRVTTSFLVPRFLLQVHLLVHHPSL